MSQRMLVWDVPTRVFHWLLVASFAGAFITSESERYRDIHVMLGYTLLGLIVFRLVWGFVGTRYAQFRSFLFKPAEIARYIVSMLKVKPEHYAGHNPAGSLAVFALLALGIITGVTGVMVFQDIGGDALAEIHELASDGMLAVVVLHVMGVLASSVIHRENLVRAMITGYKSYRPNEHGGEASTTHNNQHARSPLPNPLPQVGEGANELLREFDVNEGISRSYAWLGVIILAVVVAFWAGFPALTAQGTDVSTSEQQRNP